MKFAGPAHRRRGPHGVVGHRARRQSLVVSAATSAAQENPGLYLLESERRRAQGRPAHAEGADLARSSSATTASRSTSRANDIKRRLVRDLSLRRRDRQARARVRPAGPVGRSPITRATAGCSCKALGSTQQESISTTSRRKKLTPLLGQGEVEEYEVAFGAKPGQILVRTNKLGDFHRLYTLEGGKLTPITPEREVRRRRLRDRRRAHAHLLHGQRGRLHALARARREDAQAVALPKLPAADTRRGRRRRRATAASSQLAVERRDSCRRRPSPSTGRRRSSTTWRVPMTPEIDVDASSRRSTLEYVPGARRHEDPDVRAAPGDVRSGALPGRRVVPRRPRGPVAAGFSTARAAVRRRWLHLRRSRTCAARRATARRGSTPTTARSASSVITDIEDAAKYIRTAWAKNGVAPKIGVDRRQLRRLLDADGDDVLRRRVRRGRRARRHLEPDTFLMNTAPYRRILRITEYGDPVKDKDALDKLSPITHVDEDQGAAAADPGRQRSARAGRRGARRSIATLERRKIPGGLILFPDEGHGASKRGNIVLQIGHTIAFFEKHLLGK